MSSEKKIFFTLDRKVLEQHGFHITLKGTGGLKSTDEGNLRFVTLSVDPDMSGQYIAARFSEIDTSIPFKDRKKFWYPTDQLEVVAEYVIRLSRPENPGLTENMLLWNAPIEGNESFPYTVVGVTRNQMFPGYRAIISQDFVMMPDGYSGVLRHAPMPDRLDPTDWHKVRLTLSQYSAKIEVAQGDQGYVVILDSDLPNPIEPLGIEFSLDNEVSPGVFVPVVEADVLDVASLSLRYVNAN